MQESALLAVEPEFMIRAILHRRERLMQLIPKQLDSRKDELKTAESLARDAKQRRDDFNQELKVQQTKITSLKPGTKEYEALQDSIQKMKDENALKEQSYLENEMFRRRCDSRTKRLTIALDECERAIEFWTSILENGWTHLLQDAQRVQEGGFSSFSQQARKRGEQN